MVTQFIPCGGGRAARALVGALALVASATSLPAQAAVIQVGTPQAVLPGTLRDPLGTLSAGLPADAILVPIEITGASGLQDWGFDLTFDGTVVQPLDLFGLYQWVYQAEFSATEPAASDITASGFLLGDLLQGVSGFSSGISGDGVLAFLLFQFLPAHGDSDPGFEIVDPPVNQTPEPGSLALLAASLAAAAVIRRHRTAPISHYPTERRPS